MYNDNDPNNNNNQNFNPNNQYNYSNQLPPNYQATVHNPDAYYQSNQNIYNPPPYQGNNNPSYPYNYPPSQQQIYIQVPIATQQIYVENQIVSRDPQAFYCPYCLTNVVTEVKYEPGDKTSLMACCLCFFGGVICCFIPYCVNDCQDAIHFCPLCHSTLGKIPF